MLVVLLACAAPVAGPTDTGDTAAPLPAWSPAPWLAEAEHFTVPAERGLTWELEDTRIEGYAVPQIFVAPDGRFGMLATWMAGNVEDRYVLWSDDGVTWTEGGVFMASDAFPYTCGDRLEDAAVWREDAGTWTFLFEGTEFVEGGGLSLEPRNLCAATTTDLETWTFDNAIFWAGVDEDDRVSVPAILPFASEGARLWYNGDLNANTDEGPGVRMSALDRAGVTPVHADPLMDWDHVDPMPVFREGGGVRLYHSRFRGEQGEAGLRVVELDGDLLPADDGALLLASPGDCGEPPSGECYMDPTFLALDDGTLYLYFTIATSDGGSLTSAIGRAVARD